MKHSEAVFTGLIWLAGFVLVLVGFFTALINAI